MTRINDTGRPREVHRTVSPVPSEPKAKQKKVSPDEYLEAPKGVAGATLNPASAAAEKVAVDFFAAFSARDSATMEKMYDSGVRFHDPLFGSLDGVGEVMAMWKTILPVADPKTFKVQPRLEGKPIARPDGSWDVKVHWDAHYDISLISRHIDNSSDTTLNIKEGKIVAQRDDWNLANWTNQFLPMVPPMLISTAAHAFIEARAFMSKMIKG